MKILNPISVDSRDVWNVDPICHVFVLQVIDDEEPMVVEKWIPTDEDFYAAEAFGIRKMNELYSTGEPELYSLGG